MSSKTFFRNVPGVLIIIVALISFIGLTLGANPIFGGAYSGIIGDCITTTLRYHSAISNIENLFVIILLLKLVYPYTFNVRTMERIKYHVWLFIGLYLHLVTIGLYTFFYPQVILRSSFLHASSSTEELNTLIFNVIGHSVILMVLGLLSLRILEKHKFIRLLNFIVPIIVLFFSLWAIISTDYKHCPDIGG